MQNAHNLQFFVWSHAEDGEGQGAVESGEIQSKAIVGTDRLRLEESDAWEGRRRGGTRSETRLDRDRMNYSGVVSSQSARSMRRQYETMLPEEAEIHPFQVPRADLNFRLKLM